MAKKKEKTLGQIKSILVHSGSRALNDVIEIKYKSDIPLKDNSLPQRKDYMDMTDFVFGIADFIDNTLKINESFYTHKSEFKVKGFYRESGYRRCGGVETKCFGD